MIDIGINRSTSQYKAVQMNPNCLLQSDHTVELAHFYTHFDKNLNIITSITAAIRLDFL